MRNIGLIILLLLWLLIGRWMCTCYCEACCEKPAETVEAVAPPPAPVAKTIDCPDEPICFGKDDCEPHLGTGFVAMRDSLIELIPDGGSLRIIGTYGPSEKNDSEYDNLGLCRANALKSEFAKVFDPGRLQAAAQLTVGQGAFNNGVSTDRIRFDMVEADAPDIPNSTLIYFPFNSTNKLDDGDVEAYLDSVADRVKASGERVSLTGHTDNVGQDASNLALGQRRAQVIKDYLVAKGVSSAKVSVDSRGESQPVATNSTDAGRAKNRRTELRIIN